MEIVTGNDGVKYVKMTKEQYNDFVKSLEELQKELVTIKSKYLKKYKPQKKYTAYEAFHDHEIVVLLEQSYPYQEADKMVNEMWNNLTYDEKMKIIPNESK